MRLAPYVVSEAAFYQAHGHSARAAFHWRSEHRRRLCWLSGLASAHGASADALLGLLPMPLTFSRSERVVCTSRSRPRRQRGCAGHGRSKRLVEQEIKAVPRATQDGHACQIKTLCQVLYRFARQDNVHQTHSAGIATKACRASELGVVVRIERSGSPACSHMTVSLTQSPAKSLLCN